MNTEETHAVTGAFGFSGKYIARRLLANGYKVRTLTNSKQRPKDLADKIDIFPFNFNNTDKMVEALQGCSVLYNTYWIRFNYKTFNHSVAVENSLKLFDAAKRAGVKRIVHTSITNPDKKSHLSYFSGKAILENAIKESGMQYSILRPAVIFGVEDILINNIAWMLRKFPVFGIFGKGDYKLQPIFVEDYAKLAIECALKTKNEIVNAIGTETFSYIDMVKQIGEIIGNPPRLMSIPDSMGVFLGKIIGYFVGDVVITKEEIDGLKSNLLFVETKPTGSTKLTDWILENKLIVGNKYANELGRRK